MINNYLIVFCLIGITGCATRQVPKEDVKYPQTEKTVQILSDSSYVTSVSSMLCRDTFLYVAENKRSQILVLDTNLMLIHTISRSGRGPDELMDIGSFALTGEDTIVVNDCGNNRLQLFSSYGKHIRSIPLENINVNLIRGFLYNSGKLVGTSLKDSAHICHQLNDDGAWEIQKQFGKRFSFQSDTKDQVRNDRYLLSWGRDIISISDNQPEIAIYDQNYHLLLNYSYAQLDVVTEQINVMNHKNLSDNSYMVLVNSCSLRGNNLYLLMNRFTPQYSANMIIRFALDKLSCSVKMEKIYFLPDTYYAGFAVDEAHIYTFGEQGFQKFNL